MNKLKIILQSKYFYLSLFLLLLIVSLINFSTPLKSNYTENDKTIKGTIISYTIKDNTLKITLQAKEKIIAYKNIKDQEELQNLKTMMQAHADIVAKGTFKKPPSNELPHVFSYQKYLANQKIYWLFFIDDLQIKPNQNLIYKIKNLWLKRFDKIPNSYIKAFIANQKEVDLDIFYQNNIGHIFAISGMHVAFLLIILNKIFKKKPIIIFILWFYAFLVNFPISAVRVILCYTIKSLNLELTNRQILFLSAFLILIINPYNLLDISFLYTYLIALGLTFFDQKNCHCKSLSLSIYLFFLIIPLNASKDFTINFLAIFINIIATYYLTILYSLALLSYIIPYISNIFTFFMDIFLKINEYFGQIKSFQIVMPYFCPIFWLLYYFFFYKSFILHQKKYFILIILFFLIFNSYPKFLKEAKISYLSVGQGDSSLLVSPNLKHSYLIDCGGSLSNNYTVKNMVTYFHSLGLNKIDALILSHGDYDHAGNTIELINEFPITKIITNNNDYNELEMKINKVKPLNKFTTINNFFKIQNINPLKDDQDENTASLVLEVTFWQYKLLFMGDAPIKVEEKLLNKNIQSLILKVGHHGSKTSSSINFLKKVNPKLAIISAGENNIYNHPHKQVIDNLKKLNISYYVTKSSKTIETIFTKKDYQINPIFDTMNKEEGIQ